MYCARPALKMKIKRQKQVRRFLHIYKSIYRYREPYLVLADGTFCQAAVTCKLEARKRLSVYLGAATQCCTTKCILSELELLGKGMFDARMLAQRFQLRDCKHKKPVTASECILSLVLNKNKTKYFVATQDSSLTKQIRAEPGIPLLYLHKSVLVLEKPSDATLNNVKLLNERKLCGSEVDRIKEIKKHVGLIPKQAKIEEPNRKKRRKRGRRKIR